MGVFQIFQDRFFYELLISIQEGLLKALVLVPPLFAAENHHSVSSYGCERHFLRKLHSAGIYIVTVTLARIRILNCVSSECGFKNKMYKSFMKDSVYLS